ncbi:MAG TPA: nuclear transport factor 2 family protein [Acidobacteriaceae bacterium]|nr:nuclear transport factor 2 family protein [Acidobacteriaceae bacterium]
MSRSALETVGSFISAINGQDLLTLRTLMSAEHVFVDARGTRYCGADVMLENWKQFFYAYPQYWISIDSNFADGNRVALFGTVGGKWRVDGIVLPGSWRVTAAWLAEVEYGKIRRWSVFCDTTCATPPQLPMESVALTAAVV